MMGLARDHSTPYIKVDECHTCGEPFRKGEKNTTRLKIFDDPWAEKPSIIKVHTGNDDDVHTYGTCLDRVFDESWADFRYFLCEKCGRHIIRQCPDNGWRSYVKVVDDKEICVQCYQMLRLKEGEDRASFVAGKIPGDFYGEKEISANGWAQVPGTGHFFVNGREKVQGFCAIALKLFDDGFKVLVDYDSMGIGGGEGYVTMYSKNTEKEDLENGDKKIKVG